MILEFLNSKINNSSTKQITNKQKDSSHACKACYKTCNWEIVNINYIQRMSSIMRKIQNVRIHEQAVNREDGNIGKETK